MDPILVIVLVLVVLILLVGGGGWYTYSGYRRPAVPGEVWTGPPGYIPYVGIFIALLVILVVLKLAGVI